MENVLFLHQVLRKPFNLLKTRRISMSGFKEKAKVLFLREKGLNIENVEYMDMPESKDDYVLTKVIGNVNLTEGRFRIKSEADAIVNYFLEMPLP